jgi:hypothetical protein
MAQETTLIFGSLVRIVQHCTLTATLAILLLFIPAEVAHAQGCPIKVLGGIGQNQSGQPAQPRVDQPVQARPLTMADHIRNLVSSGAVSGRHTSAEAFPFNTPQPLKLAPGSRIWLNGSSNVIDFTCEVGEMHLVGEMAALSAVATPGVHGANPPHGAVSLRLRIPVDKLDCGQRGINKDMMNTLNATRFPYIEYTLGPNRLIQSHDLEDRFFMDIETTGSLTISGHSRTERIEVEGEFLGPWRFRIRGCHGVEMPDYGLTPPSPMFGMIKVDSHLVVNFDVTLMLEI